MARTSLITLGLAQIEVGAASAAGTMPTSMTKIGKTYKDTCKMTQDSPDVTEHYEEGKAAPEVRKKSRKIPKFYFSLMDCDAQALADYVGGTVTGNNWAYDGNEVVANRAIRIKTEQGLSFEMPNADIEAVINAEFTSGGIFLVDFTVTPLAVTSGKALRGIPNA